MKQTTRINPAFEEYADFVRHLPERFDSEGTLIYSARNSVRTFTMPDGRIVVVKSFKKPNSVQKVAYTWFRKSKARRAFEYAGELKASGFDTPESIGYVEVFRSGLLAESYFASTYTGRRPLRDFFEEGAEPDAALVRAVALYMASLHEKGIMHGDPNMTNILAEKVGGEYRFELIDTNRSRLGHPLTEGERMFNLVRLTHNRKISAAVSREYALATGRDPDGTVRAVARGLEEFEAGIHRRQRLKRFFRELFSPAKCRK